MRTTRTVIRTVWRVLCDELDEQVGCAAVLSTGKQRDAHLYLRHLAGEHSGEAR